MAAGTVRHPTLLNSVTLTLYYPFFQARQQGFLVSNSYFGRRPFRFDGRGRDLFGAYVVALLLLVPTLGLYLFWFNARKTRYFWGHTYFETARYIIVGRDVRDVFMSMWNHHTGYTDETKALFPSLEESVRKEIADNIRQLVAALKPYGAKEVPFRHPRIHTYDLPSGTKLTFSDFSGTGRGSAYLQIDLEPTIPAPAHACLPAFPGAEGFGSLTPGGGVL